MSQALELFWSFDGNNSEVEDLSDIDDPAGDPEYQPSRQEQSSSEEDSSGCEDPIPSPLNLTGDVRNVRNMKDIVQMATLPDHARVMTQTMSLKRQHQDQAIKISPKKFVGCDGRLLI